MNLGIPLLILISTDTGKGSIPSKDAPRNLVSLHVSITGTGAEKFRPRAFFLKTSLSLPDLQ
ncbi:hypothetical protein [Leptospira andrefontaineae]|uniref:hypothetical protein n=1 Tax=Leptospira andrefontaineae TaxID=2484976 RepID=UPI001FC93FD7|nr:hypothetical protein [Leptospira andrefontaineae]